MEKWNFFKNIRIFRKRIRNLKIDFQKVNDNNQENRINQAAIRITRFPCVESIKCQERKCFTIQFLTNINKISKP